VARYRIESRRGKKPTPEETAHRFEAAQHGEAPLHIEASLHVEAVQSDEIVRSDGAAELPSTEAASGPRQATDETTRAATFVNLFSGNVRLLPPSGKLSLQSSPPAFEPSSASASIGPSEESVCSETSSAAVDTGDNRVPSLAASLPSAIGSPNNEKRRSHRKWYLAPLLVVVAAAAVGGIQLSRGLPDPVVRAVVLRSVQVSAALSPIPWPAQGQAAVAVPALGIVKASGLESSVPIASLTKIMTAYLVLRDHPIAPNAQGPVVRVTAADQNEAGMDESDDDTSVPVAQGEQLSERQLLDGLMVHSANNFADILARWDAGSTTAFVAKMNSEAAALEMAQTHYADANGISSASVSTAADQLRLTSLAVQLPTFAAVVDQPSVDLPVAGRLYNYVGVIGSKGIVGVKSGFTQAAMGCLVLAGDRDVDGHRVLVLAAVTGQGGPRPLDAAAEAALPMIDATAANLHVVRVVAAHQQVASISVPWASHPVGVAVAKAMDALAWPGEVVRAAIKMRSVSDPTAKGTVLGSVTLWVGGERQSEQVRSVGELPSPTLGWRLTNF
jgi:D-alanyl-D-alanine carboxypeptidase (penicillin-binding protein 5/6)